MAYAVKYLFKFQSSNGTVREIRVLKDGYSGSVIQRPLGRAPVIKKEKNGGVHGTSLTFYAECHIDREYIEFYTSDPKEYRVDVYAGSTLLWQGYITPELYSEPDIAPPYDVQVVATDGVGELKLYDFAPQGTVTLRALLSYLLGYTGLTTDVNLVSSLKPGSRGAGALLDMQICVDYLAGKTCYEALTYILTTLHATITRWGGAWVLVRETNVTFTSDKVRYFNTSGNSALLSGSVQTLGAMRAAPAWPVGQLSTVIDPAKNKVMVQAPWHPVSGLANSDMTSDTGWTKDKNARYDTDGYVLPTNVLTPVSETAVISQAVSLVGLRVALSISVKATGSTSEIAGQAYGALMGVFVTYKVGNVTYYLIKGEDGAPAWEQGDNIGTYVPPRTRVDYQQTLSVWDASRIEAEELKIDNIPPFLSGTSFPSGTLTVYILGSCVKVYGAYLDVMLPKGYQDVLRIDNGARGEGDSVEIAIGRVTSEVVYYQSFLQGLLLDTGSIITAFSDANFTTAMDYLALISRDYALSAALPRALAKGTVYLESSIGMPPLVFAKGGLNYWLETWSWDLYEDELEIDARTLPSASLTVQSETILESDGSTVSSSSSGSSGGGSSISPGGGVTYFEPHNDGIILKADYEYVSVPDVLLGEDEESLNALLAVIAGNAVQGAAAYGYFDNGVLPYNHGGTGLSSYTKGDLLYASANNTLAKLAANSTGTKKFLTMTSSDPSWDGIAFGDLPTLYWANVAVSSSSSTTTEPTVKSITIGGATLTWVAPVGTTPGYLRINSPLLTDGDQIVGSGTPGGGGGGGASYLYELNDFQSGQSKATTSGTMLMYDSNISPRVGAAGSGAWKYASPSDVATAIGLGNYLPLTAGSSKPLTGDLYITGGSGRVVLAGVIQYNPATSVTRLLGPLISDDNDLNWYDGSAWRKVWHAGNDGASSGLDADLLDGQHGSYYNNLLAFYDSNTTSADDITYPMALLATGTPTAAYYYVSTMFFGSVGSAQASQIATSYNAATPQMYIRQKYSGTWFAWQQVYHSGNLTKSVLTGLLDASGGYYLPLTGGTLSNSTRDFLKINSTDANGPYVHFQISGTTKGYIGYYVASGVDALWLGASTNRLFLDTTAASLRVGTDSTNYVVYHSGNSNSTSISWNASTIALGDTTPIHFYGAGSGTYNMGVVYCSTSGWTLEAPKVSNSATAANVPIKFGWRGGTAAIYVDASANVGIGTTSPGYKLEVSGTSGWTTRIISTNSAIYAVHNDGYGFFVGSKQSSSSYYLLSLSYGQTTLGSGGTSAFYVRADGNVGIGTSSPGAKLEVAGDILINASGYTSLTFADSTQTRWVFSKRPTQNHLYLMRHNSSQTFDTVMAFDYTSGNVGIGTGSPDSLLYVNGLTKIMEPTNARFSITMSSPQIILSNISSAYSGGWTAGLNAGTNGTSAGCIAGVYMSGSTIERYWYGGTSYSSALMVILPGGNVGIGTVAPSQKLHVAGTILSTGDQVISSDINLKTNLQDVTYTIEDIAKTRAVTFDWKDGRGHSAGSIAQDWKPLIPELVHGEEGNMTLAYGQIALVNTIIEAREIDVLKKRVAELEAEVQRLRS